MRRQPMLMLMLLLLYSNDLVIATEVNINETSLRSESYTITNGNHSLSRISPPHQHEQAETEEEQTENELGMPMGSTLPYDSHLTRTSVLFGLTKVANESSVSPLCIHHLHRVQRGIYARQPWAMKALDASGTKPSGFLFGQNYWLGSKEGCDGVQRSVGVTLSRNYERVMHYGILTERAPFDMDYRVIYLRHRSPWQVEIKLMSEQIVHIGLCLPRVCSSAEIKQITQEYVEQDLLTDIEIFDIRPEVLYIKELRLRDSFYQRTSFKLLVGGVLVTCALILCAQQLNTSPCGKENLAPAESELWRAFHELLQWRRLKAVIACYDVPTNCSKIFVMRDHSPSEIPVMNGLRSVCAFWIMVFHVLWYMYFTVHNKAMLISYAERAFFQYVSSAPLLVDVFFTISGFLHTYNFLRNSQQLAVIRQNGWQQNAKLFGKLLFHRYLRLGPLYLVVMCTVDLVYAYIGDVSVYHIHERLDEMCTQHWWRNLLFIQNLFDHRDMCANWSWSLACEMQFFILANLLLFLYAKNARRAQMLVVAALVANLGWTYIMGIVIKFELSFDAAYATASEMYTSPFVRVMPYILGAIAAWGFLEKPNLPTLTVTQERSLWHLSLLIFFACIYSTVKRDVNYFIATSLFVFGRFAFSLSVCWMILGSATGRGVWWSRLLEAKGFQHLSRLSYAIYLLNPIIIVLFYGLTSYSAHVDPFFLCVVSCGFAVIVYLASIVYSLGFELPYCNLSGLLLRRRQLLKIKNSD